MEIKRLAVDELRVKMALEDVAKPKIQRLFRDILRENKNIMAMTGGPVSTARFMPSWRNFLQDHYVMVQKEFIDVQVKIWNIKQTEDPLTPEAVRDYALSLWISTTVPEAAGAILATTDDQINEALIEARHILEAESQPVTNEALAATVTRLLANRFSGRVPTIAMAETQQAAESTKLIAAQVVSGLAPFNVPQLEPNLPTPARPEDPRQRQILTKRWQTVGDDRVRFTHVKANGMIVLAEEPFQLIDGALLNYPGDTSLGAPIEDWINCRCSAIYKRVGAI